MSATERNLASNVLALLAQTTDTAGRWKTKETEHDEHKVDFAAPGTLQYKLADRTLLPLTANAIENVDSPPDSSQRELMPVDSGFGGFCFLGEGCMCCSASRY